MKIFVLGATGVAGRSTLPLLLAAGHDVKAHVRSPENAERLRRVGVETVRGDAEDPSELAPWLRGRDVVVDFRVQVPSAARSVLPGAWSRYAHLRDAAVGTLVDTAVREGVERVIHDTVVMVYEGDPEAWLTEDAPVRARGPLQANLAAERHLERLTREGGTGVALRLGQLYGPADDFSLSVARAATRGWSFAHGSDEGWTSALHTDDIGPAVCSALDVPAGVYNVVDAEPIRRGELVQLLAHAVGRTGLHRPPGWTMSLASEPVRSVGRSQRVSAAKLTGVTGWRPAVPSRREGWPAAMSALLSGAPQDSSVRRT